MRSLRVSLAGINWSLDTYPGRKTDVEFEERQTLTVKLLETNNSKVDCSFNIPFRIYFYFLDLSWRFLSTYLY